MSQVSFFDILIIGDLAVRGNFVFCLIIVVVFIGLGRAYTLWWGGGGGWWGRAWETICLEEVDPSRHHLKILIWRF